MPHSEEGEPTPHILFLDAYDSFTNNIVALLKTQISCNIHVVKIDDPLYAPNAENFEHLLRSFDAVVAGPGPGSPTRQQDVGLIGRLWTLQYETILPVLGICLGFQSLACAFGGQVERLPEPRHGIIQQICHNGTSLFKDTKEVFATQYHSLRINLCHEHESITNSHTTPEALWRPSSTCPALQPLAWVRNDVDNGTTLMSIRHVTKPFHGIQFHPESICTNTECHTVIRNWWDSARQWLYKHRRHRRLLALPVTQPKNTIPKLAAAQAAEHNPTRLKQHHRKVTWDTITSPSNIHFPTLITLLTTSPTSTPLLLESGTNTASGALVNPETGRFSILGLPSGAEHIQYHTSTRTLLRFQQSDRDGDSTGDVDTRKNVQHVWEYLSGYMKQRHMMGGPPSSPFWGGLLGFASYEACLNTIGIGVSSSSSPTADGRTAERPDLWFLYVRRSVVVDHVARRMFIQSTVPFDEVWIAETKALLQNGMKLAELHSEISKSLYTPSYQDVRRHSIEEFRTHSTMPRRRSSALPPKSSKLPQKPASHISQTHHPQIHGPVRTDYCQKVRTCQQHIRAGDSYELCLTDQTHITLSNPSILTPWHLYQRLRTLNPAPFSAYLHLRTPTQAVTVLSSSPERFLSWNRTGHCQFRPIKGTVKKSSNMTREKAERILNSSKERAENLMIVDLIRHDLHGVVGAGNVQVAKLMEVEEYETVYQLVSVIEGWIPEDAAGTIGIDVLAASLPPGSMTGAPKRRSCELLQEIEGNVPRGIYSGVLGYMDVGGGGDFSVVIRTASMWEGCGDGEWNGEVLSEDDDGDMTSVQGGERKQVWSIGAGGAVTSQSTDVGEWEEMLAKRDALLKMFEGFT